MFLDVVVSWLHLTVTIAVSRAWAISALPSESGPCAQLRCPTAGTSVAPLVPLVRSLGAWLALPRPSRWVLRTIRLGYAIQFARRPPKFRGVRFTSVLNKDAPVLRAEIAVLLAKDAIEPVPPAEMKSGFYSLYFIVPKKGGGLRPILDLRVLNRALHKLPFRMLMQKRIFQCIRPFDWFAAIDLKDTYIHVSIPPQHSPFLRFAFEGRAYQYKVLPFGHLSRLGLRVNWEKSKLSPVQRISFLGMELDSVNLTARLSVERAQSMLNCLESFQRKRAVPLKHFQRLLGHMASAAAVTPLGLLHMRPLQHWLHDRVPRWAWRRGTYRVSVTPSCHQTFGPWSDLAFLRGRSSPSASIQACCCVNRCLCHGLGSHVQRACSCGALDRVPIAVACQLPRVASSMACSAPLQSAATRQACTGPYGQHCDRCVHQPPGRSTIPSHVAIHPPSPPLESEASEVASCRSYPWRAQSCSRRALTSAHPSGRMATPPRGSPADLETLRGRSGRPVCLPGHVPLPAVLLPVRGDPRHGRAGTQLASGPTQICVSPSEPSRTDPVQGQGGRGAGPLGGAVLAQSDLVPRTGAPRDSPSLANSSEEGSPFSERGHPLAPASRLVESPRMVPWRDAEVLGGLPPLVVNTITSARAPSTRHAYRLKWNLFIDWCSPRREDPRRCPITVVLSFLQDGLERRLSPSTLKVYVAAIAAHHDAVNGKSVGKHDLVVRFLRGARRLNPPRPHLVPSWDLPSVLTALKEEPFEPLQSVELKFLSLKTVLLTALASVKRVGDLQAFSVNDSCLEFGPAESHVVLRPRPGYVPKVPTTPFRDQVVNLQALPREEADPAIALLCPVRALRVYVDRTQSFRTSYQLFVCFRGQQKGKAVSKQRLAHWIVEAIVLAYQARRLPCPLGVRAHSTRGVASSWALARGASIADICRAAGWAAPNTFARFYNLCVEPVSSRVLASDGQ